MRNPNVTKTLQWTALILVLAVTSALVTLLFLQQRQYRTEAAVARTAESVESTPQPSSSPTESSQAEKSAKSAAAAKIAAMAVVNGLQSPVISVLGDSTSDSSSEWVYRWAEELGQNATVVVHTWNPQTKDWFPQPRRFGQGERTITIWNGSESGATPRTPLAQEDLRQPQPAHLTILNYGHNGNADEVEPALSELLEAVQAGEEAPVVLTAQNPATGENATTSDANRALMEAAATKHGLPVIDVHAAFDDAESWEALLVDQIHPNDQGQQLWAETVSAFFTR
ncbi:SGNH/GDSL hydrolase family protein [Citricoccus sp.]|uniref:SGNH/GDSL hydrolase family protein n=1 Tax=Citricoccus sp. TaxID=1978372 RepID=UPI00262995CE|nr:SGNH/GDSL hydrolase family protein [Citricoccus sp.]HRO31318.1 SGNH/GDSL hydrolase family protein [Citricoccus sp.]